MFLKWIRRKNKNQETKQNTNSIQKVKGGINVNIESAKKNSELEVIMVHIDGITDKLFEEQNKIQNQLLKLSMAFKIYVENNGVEPHIKKIVSDILKNK